MAFRNGVVAVGGLFVQAAINGHGKLFVAGMAAAEKFFELVPFTGGAFVLAMTGARLFPKESSKVPTAGL